MERQLVASISEIIGFEYTCPTSTCGARFIRTINDLEAWCEKAHPKREDKREPLCSFCRDKGRGNKLDEAQGVMGNLVNLWRSPLSEELKLRFVILAEHDVEKEGEA